ncbi:MAG: hypothetical protein JJU03_04435, partial [Idiomarina sp.]|nr:hypothetical protein [Idiomarina sp.]
MSWYKAISEILDNEPEEWLAYMHGQQISKLPHLLEKGPKYKGLLVQIIKYLRSLFSSVDIWSDESIKKSPKFIVYAGTKNQLDSLASTVTSLINHEEDVVMIVDEKLVGRNELIEKYTPYRLKPVDVYRAIVLLLIRGRALRKRLKVIHRKSLDWHFSWFCSVYPAVAYFYRVLKESEPRCVVIANDHSATNRCLLAAAHYLKIKTVYLQHASVSPIFPALRVNYAFLDGEAALKIYRLCEPNQPTSNSLSPMPAIFLSGQKKIINKMKVFPHDKVGLAINSLDKPQAVIALVYFLIREGLNVVLRWHPAHLKKDIDLYLQEFELQSAVFFSDPTREPVSFFLSKINYMIAGNSSIHLEA